MSHDSFNCEFADVCDPVCQDFPESCPFYCEFADVCDQDCQDFPEFCPFYKELKV